FALGPQHFREILANREVWTDEYIERAMEYTLAKIKMGKVRQSASGYLMKALREGYILGKQDKVIIEQQMAQRAKERQNQATIENAKQLVQDDVQTFASKGLAIWETMDEDTRRESYAKF